MSRLPDLEAWALFARTVEWGSFAKAAESAGVSQPTVSKAISRLEHRLGATLLNRSSRGFSLTPTGQTVLDKANLILQAGEAADIEASEEASALCGLVRISAPALFGARYLAPLIPAFLNRNPGIEIEISSNDHQADLRPDGFDLAVRSGMLSDSSFRVRRLCSVRRCMVASPDYLARHGMPEHPRDLRQHECLISADRAASEEWLLRHGSGEECSVPVRGRLRVSTAETLTPALLAGAGVALQTEFLVREDLAAGRLQRVLPEWSVDDLVFNLVSSPAKWRPARVTAVKDYLSRQLVNAVH